MCSNFDTVSSKSSMFEIVNVSTFEKNATISLTNLAFSSLFLAINCLFNSICSSMIHSHWLSACKKIKMKKLK